MSTHDPRYPGFTTLDPDPLTQLARWIDDARAAGTIESRHALESRFSAVVARFGVGEDVLRPPGWGGVDTGSWRGAWSSGQGDRTACMTGCAAHEGVDGSWAPQRLMP